MHQSEAVESDLCADCGAELASGRDRTYALSDESEICFACAVRRGGSYDELHDRWEPQPDVTDLLEREREAERALAP